MILLLPTLLAAAFTSAAAVGYGDNGYDQYNNGPYSEYAGPPSYPSRQYGPYQPSYYPPQQQHGNTYGHSYTQEGNHGVRTGGYVRQYNRGYGGYGGYNQHQRVEYAKSYECTENQESYPSYGPQSNTLSCRDGYNYFQCTLGYQESYGGGYGSVPCNRYGYNSPLSCVEQQSYGYNSYNSYAPTVYKCTESGSYGQVTQTYGSNGYGNSYANNNYNQGYNQGYNTYNNQYDSYGHGHGPSQSYNNGPSYRPNSYGNHGNNYNSYNNGGYNQGGYGDNHGHGNGYGNGYGNGHGNGGYGQGKGPASQVFYGAYGNLGGFSLYDVEKGAEGDKDENADKCKRICNINSYGKQDCKHKCCNYQCPHLCMEKSCCKRTNRGDKEATQHCIQQLPYNQKRCRFSCYIRAEQLDGKEGTYRIEENFARYFNAKREHATGAFRAYSKHFKELNQGDNGAKTHADLYQSITPEHEICNGKGCRGGGRGGGRGGRGGRNGFTPGSAIVDPTIAQTGPGPIPQPQPLPNDVPFY